MIPLPTVLARFVADTGRIMSPWIQYLQQFTQRPPNVMPLTVGASPFDYVAKEPGSVVVTGGTITTISLTRGNVTIILGNTVKIIPVGIDDTVTVTYAVLPTIQFIPAYGQNTNV